MFLFCNLDLDFLSTLWYVPFQINEHRATLDPKHPRDVIDNYLQERGDDPTLTDRVFASNILILFPDAIDTAAHLLEFIMLYLAHNPLWQREVGSPYVHANRATHSQFLIKTLNRIIRL